MSLIADTPLRRGIDLSPSSELSRYFWEQCNAGRLVYQYFPESGHAQFPPAIYDRFSGSPHFEWRESEGKGRIYSWSLVARPVSNDFTTPYVAAIVELDEGYHMVSNVVSCDSSVLNIGLRVGLVFSADNGAGQAVPYFRPIEP